MGVFAEQRSQGDHQFRLDDQHRGDQRRGVRRPVEVGLRAPDHDHVALRQRTDQDLGARPGDGALPVRRQGSDRAGDLKVVVVAGIERYRDGCVVCRHQMVDGVRRCLGSVAPAGERHDHDRSAEVAKISLGHARQATGPRRWPRPDRHQEWATGPVGDQFQPAARPSTRSAAIRS